MCPLKHALPSVLVEEMLAERVNRMTAAYTLQDWACVKCKQVRMLLNYYSVWCQNCYLPLLDRRPSDEEHVRL